MLQSGWLISLSFLFFGLGNCAVIPHFATPQLKFPEHQDQPQTRIPYWRPAIAYSVCCAWERNNGQLRAKLNQNCKKTQALEHLNRRIGAQRFEMKRSLLFKLQGLQRLNQHLQAQLQKDSDESHRMRQLIRKLKWTCDRLRKNRATLRGALDALTDYNMLTAVSLHRNGQLEVRILEHQRQQVGGWVRTAYTF